MYIQYRGPAGGVVRCGPRDQERADGLHTERVPGTYVDIHICVHLLY